MSVQSHLEGVLEQIIGHVVRDNFFFWWIIDRPCKSGEKKTVRASQKAHRTNYEDQSVNVSEIIAACVDGQADRLNGILLGQNAKTEEFEVTEPIRYVSPHILTWGRKRICLSKSCVSVKKIGHCCRGKKKKQTDVCASNSLRMFAWFKTYILADGFWQKQKKVLWRSPEENEMRSSKITKFAALFKEHFFMQIRIKRVCTNVSKAQMTSCNFVFLRLLLVSNEIVYYLKLSRHFLKSLVRGGGSHPRH